MAGGLRRRERSGTAGDENELSTELRRVRELAEEALGEAQQRTRRSTRAEGRTCGIAWQAVYGLRVPHFPLPLMTLSLPRRSRETASSDLKSKWRSTRRAFGSMCTTKLKATRGSRTYFRNASREFPLQQ